MGARGSTATTEDHRVTALEADHVLARLGFLNDQLVDLILWHRVILCALAYVDLLTAALGPAEELRTTKGIVHQHVGGFDELLGPKGDKAEIAGTGADQITGA